MSWTDIKPTQPHHLAEEPQAYPGFVHPAPVEPATGRGRGGGGRVALAFVAGAALSAASFGLGAVATRSDTGGANGTPPADTPTVDNPIAGGVASVATLLSPSVVQVETPNGLGSGVVYEDGFVLTNHHVVEGSTSFIVRTADGRALEAELIGSDPRNDIAVLSLGVASGVPVADLATGVDLEVGETAVAIGSPFQLQQTVTAGIVSALNRPVPNAANGFSAMIQTDAPINPGNSGGALANSSGQVIGINASIRTDGVSSTNAGIGFAIPIDIAVNVASHIRTGSSLEPGFLGVAPATVDDTASGVQLGEVTANSAAAVAGLEVGDRVLSIDGAPVSGFAELAGLVQSRFPGESLTVVVDRDGQRLTLTVTLAAKG